MKRKRSEFPVFLDSVSFAELLCEIDTFIFDADGVLWLDSTPIVGSAEFLEFLIEHGKQILVLTNNSNKSRSALLSKMQHMRFVGMSENSIQLQENIINPAVIIIHYLLSRGFGADNRKVYLIGSKGFAEQLDDAGIEHFGCGPDPAYAGNIDDDNFLSKDAFVYRVGFDDPLTKVGAVVVGFEKHFSYVKLMRAANFLQDEECLFLGTNEDETSPGPHPKMIIPDAGPIIAAVKTAAGREPIVMGKPHSAAFEYICARWNIQPERTMMFGDRTNTDIVFGRRHGLRTTLVLSGVHSLDNVKQNQEAKRTEMVPDFYTTSLGCLIARQ
ncbi:unnamed protein product [Anisakis simplex]|uniref:4-nitrophenylphosphatase n=1 Tax=Anisakis simplex TaxID=6269 RepID=A0A0M3J0R8_ANISI|nr:unnamed protein product [Anisakis simplex]